MQPDAITLPLSAELLRDLRDRPRSLRVLAESHRIAGEATIASLYSTLANEAEAKARKEAAHEN